MLADERTANYRGFANPFFYTLFLQRDDLNFTCECDDFSSCLPRSFTFLPAISDDRINIYDCRDMPAGETVSELCKFYDNKKIEFAGGHVQISGVSEKLHSSARLARLTLTVDAVVSTFFIFYFQFPRNRT